MSCRLFIWRDSMTMTIVYYTGGGGDTPPAILDPMGAFRDPHAAHYREPGGAQANRARGEASTSAHHEDPCLIPSVSQHPPPSDQRDGFVDVMMRVRVPLDAMQRFEANPLSGSLELIIPKKGSNKALTLTPQQEDRTPESTSPPPLALMTIGSLGLPSRVYQYWHEGLPEHGSEALCNVSKGLNKTQVSSKNRISKFVKEIERCAETEGFSLEDWDTEFLNQSKRAFQGLTFANFFLMHSKLLNGKGLWDRDPAKDKGRLLRRHVHWYYTFKDPLALPYVRPPLLPTCTPGQE